MPKLLVAALLAGAAYGTMSLTSASADDMRAQSSCGWGDSSRDCYRNDYGAGVGVNSYCAPGLIPMPYPNGNGVRCQAPDGTWR